MKQTERDYELAAKIARFHDDMLIGPAEVAAFLGISQISVKTGSIKLPPRINGLNRKMQWRFGDLRAFVRDAAASEGAEVLSRRRGRPTKAEELGMAK